MPITRQPLRDVSDMTRIRSLVDSMPLSARHVVDLPWRLSSPTIHEGQDAVFWEDETGQVVGFAAWQYYWAVLDYYILPGVQQHDVERELFAWAEQRFRELDEQRGWPLPYWIEYRDDDPARLQQAVAHGFVLDEEEYYVQLHHDLQNLPATPALPEGFTLRTLTGVDEVEAYTEVHRAAFESTSMTPEWRARTLQMPQYRPELDLVIVAPDGTFAGFCVGWFAPTREVAQIEPIGVHPRFQQLGLGSALLVEILRRFKEIGATSAFVETNSGRNAARRAYESVGCEQRHRIPRKGKWVNPPCEE